MEYDKDEEQVYSRKELIYMTKLYTKASKFEEAIVFSIQYIQLNPNLTKDERNLFVTAFKNYITKRRSSWRNIHNNEKKEMIEIINQNKTEESPKLKYLKEIRNNIEKELRLGIKQMIAVIDELLLPIYEESPENSVFYLKLKGDYYRYLSEITGGENREQAIAEAEESYNTAYKISEVLPHTDSIKLGLCLNYSVFLWEIREMQQDAAIIAQNAFNQVVSKINELEKMKAKDSILIIQLLKENLIMWSKEIEEEEGVYQDDDGNNEDIHESKDHDVVGLEDEFDENNYVQGEEIVY